MYTTIDKYTLVPGSAATLKQHIQMEFKPLIGCLPGFVGYYLLEVSADELVSVSIFASKGKADLARGPTGFWMRRLSSALGDCILGQPEVVSGQTEVYSSVKACASRGVRQQLPSAGGHGAVDGDHLMRVPCSSRTPLTRKDEVNTYGQRLSVLSSSVR